MDKRHIYGIMIDTETANGLNDPLFYDVGWAIIDSKGKVYKTESFVNSDIFIREKLLMQTAYYAKKIPRYISGLESGQRKMASIYEIKKMLAKDVKDYECKFICAHNARFDYLSLNNTIRYLTKSKNRYFTPYGLTWQDTLKMAKQVIEPMPTYQKFCKDNGYLTANGKCKLTAEILYKFISLDNEFEEEHTGLEDVLIEAKIYEYCTKRHKKMNRNLWKN